MVDPVKKILGNDEMCFVCGVNKAHKKHGVYLHDYGVRKHYYVPMCKSCIKAEEKGEL